MVERNADISFQDRLEGNPELWNFPQNFVF